MSMELEDRLGNHLRSASELHSPDGNLETVRRIAKRRSLRNRVAVGACGLLALAGAASLVPTGDSPSALITAADPTSVEVPETDVDSLEPNTSQDNDDATNEAVTETTDLTVGPPSPDRIVGDGDGGFVGLAVVTIDGLHEFVRSSDGEKWVEAGELRLDAGRYLSNLRHIGGSFLAIVHESGQDAVSQGLLQPQLAVSPDLTEWRLIDFDFGADEDPLERYNITDIAIAGDEIGATLTDRFMIDYATYDLRGQDVCGSSITPSGSFLELCSGDRVPLLERDVAALSVGERQRYFRSIDGLPLMELPRDSTEQFGTDIFGTADGIDSIALGFVDPAAPDPWFDGLSSDEPHLALLVTSKPDGETVTLLRQGSRMLTLWQLNAERHVSYLPDEIVLGAESGLIAQLAEGPAGWALLLGNDGPLRQTFEANGWIATEFAPQGFTELRSTDGTESYGYGSRADSGPDFVQWSLFGDVRFVRPGTDEVLLEVSGDDVRSGWRWQLNTARDESTSQSFEHQLLVDGWSLSGDPVRGPLVLTSPDGVSREFADGFAFGNGDPTDGVEADVRSYPRTPFSMANEAAPIRFFDASGNELVAFETIDVYESLVLPAIGTLNDEGTYDPPPADTPTRDWWVLHSADATSWTVVNPENKSSLNGGSNVAVGDDEILVLDRDGVTRIELDE